MTPHTQLPSEALRAHMLSLVAQRAGLTQDTETAEALRVLSTDAGMTVLVQLVADGRQETQKNVMQPDSTPLKIVYMPDATPTAPRPRPDAPTADDIELMAYALGDLLRGHSAGAGALRAAIMGAAQDALNEHTAEWHESAQEG